MTGVQKQIEGLRDWVRAVGHSEAARLAGLSRNTIIRFVHQQRAPSMGTISALEVARAQHAATEGKQ